MPQPLGYRGAQVLDLLKHSLDKRGVVPSYSEIARDLDMSASDVCNVMRRLERRGYVERRTVGQRKKRGWHGPVVKLMR